MGRDELEKHILTLSTVAQSKSLDLVAKPVADPLKDSADCLGLLEYTLVNNEPEEPEKPCDANGLHIAFMFSSPLLFVSRDSRINVMDSLECEKEYDAIMAYMQSTKRAVKCDKWIATVDNFAQCLNERPLVLHFSGHGVVEHSTSSDGSRSEEYFLLFEDASGTAKEISKHHIQSILQKYKHVPELVFVSACYSGYLGQIFLDLGVNHVICVKLLSTVVDEVAAEFARAFYTTLFSDCTTICDAFKVAKLRVSSKFGELSGLAHEVDKFTIRCRTDTLGIHTCTSCPTIPYGVPIERPAKRFSRVPAKVSPFVGRQKDLYTLLSHITTYRLVTVVGLPGIGKSSLAVMLGHFLLEREQFADGVIHVSIGDVRTIEALAHTLFGVIAGGMGQDPDTVVGRDEGKLVLKALENANVLLILDNAEELIGKNGVQLKEWLQMVLSGAPKLRVLMSSRTRPNPFEALHSPQERVYSLRPLDPQSSVTLLLQMCMRSIDRGEVADLIKQDSTGIGPNDGELEALAKHRLTKILAGHPCIISLAGSMLLHRNLTQLYKILAQGVNNETRIMTSLKPSLIACLEALGQKDAMSMCFLKFMGFFQSPTRVSTLENIWGPDCYDHIESLMNHCLIEEMVDDKDQPSFGKYYILPFIADYVLGNLDIDVSELFDKCAAYYSNILEGALKSYVESGDARYVSMERETEQNVISLLTVFEHASKLKEGAEQACEAAEKEDELKVKPDEQCPTFEAIESLKTMIKPIAEQMTHKRERWSQPIRSMKVMREPLMSDVEARMNRSFEEPRNFLGIDSGPKAVIRNYGRLLAGYMETLIFLRRYAEADVIAVTCAGQVKNDRIALANVTKLRGLISARISEQKLKYPDYGEAKSHYGSALALFSELNCTLGMAACQVALGEVYSKVFLSSSDPPVGKVRRGHALLRQGLSILPQAHHRPLRSHIRPQN